MAPPKPGELPPPPPPVTALDPSEPIALFELKVQFDIMALPRFAKPPPKPPETPGTSSIAFAIFPTISQ